MTVARAREKTLEIMRDCNGVFGDQAQTLAADLFDEICGAEGIDATSDVFDDVIDDQLMEEKVRYYASDLKDDDWQGYEGELSDLAAYYVKRSAFENMVRNCDRNNVRYARVPRGGETCGWCMMLASRDFIYSSEEMASHGMHPHCDCIVVPGKKGVTYIEGYDPESLRRRWAMCADCAGKLPRDEDLQQRWDHMTDEQRKKYKRGRAQFFAEEKAKPIVREVERHDAEWIWTGTCSATREADLPQISEIKSRYPDAYEEWQFFASYGSSLPILEKGQEKHVPGSKEFRKERELPSYFTIGSPGEISVGAPVPEEVQKTIRAEADKMTHRLMGRGIPRITGSKWGYRELANAGEIVGYTGGPLQTKWVELRYRGGYVHGHPARNGSQK